jgi:hypothetical protein
MITFRVGRSEPTGERNRNVAFPEQAGGTYS